MCFDMSELGPIMENGIHTGGSTNIGLICYKLQIVYKPLNKHKMSKLPNLQK